MLVMSKMKVKAKTSTEPTTSIVNYEVSQIDAGFRPYLPKEAPIKHGIQRSRRQNQPALPATAADFDVIWQESTSGREVM